jgi:hypothetical protein
LPSLFVHPPTFHILIFSETTGPINLQPNFGGMVLGWPPYKIVSGDPDFQPRGRQAKNRKKGDQILIVHCCFSILDGPFPKLCPAVLLSHQDGCHSAVALLLKAALIQASDYRFLRASGLAHIAKGNVSCCYHLVSAVHRPLTFHILIFSSEIP